MSAELVIRPVTSETCRPRWTARTMAVRVRVPLAEPGRGQFDAHLLDGGSLLAARKLGLESLSVLAGDRRWIEQNQGLGTADRRLGKMGDGEQGTGNHALRGDRVQQREQATPRVPDNLERVERQLVGDGGEVFNVGLPGYGRRVIRPRPAAPALVIEHQLVVLGQREHLRQKVLVIGPRAAAPRDAWPRTVRVCAPRAGVAHHGPARAAAAVGAPEQGHWCRRSVAGIAGRWNRGHVEGKGFRRKLACSGRS